MIVQLNESLLIADDASLALLKHNGNDNEDMGCCCCKPSSRLVSYTSDAIAGLPDGVNDLTKYAKVEQKKVPRICELLREAFRKEFKRKNVPGVANIVYCLIELTHSCPQRLASLEPTILSLTTKLLSRPTDAEGAFSFLAYSLFINYLDYRPDPLTYPNLQTHLTQFFTLYHIPTENSNTETRLWHITLSTIHKCINSFGSKMLSVLHISAHSLLSFYTTVFTPLIFSSHPQSLIPNKKDTSNVSVHNAPLPNSSFIPPFWIPPNFSETTGAQLLFPQSLPSSFASIPQQTSPFPFTPTLLSYSFETIVSQTDLSLLSFELIREALNSPDSAVVKRLIVIMVITAAKAVDAEVFAHMINSSFEEDEVQITAGINKSAELFLNTYRMLTTTTQPQQSLSSSSHQLHMQTESNSETAAEEQLQQRSQPQAATAVTVSTPSQSPSPSQMKQTSRQASPSLHIIKVLALFLRPKFTLFALNLLFSLLSRPTTILHHHPALSSVPPLPPPSRKSPTFADTIKEKLGTKTPHPTQHTQNSHNTQHTQYSQNMSNDFFQFCQGAVSKCPAELRAAIKLMQQCRVVQFLSCFIFHSPNRPPSSLPAELSAQLLQMMSYSVAVVLRTNQSTAPSRSPSALSSSTSSSSSFSSFSVLSPHKQSSSNSIQSSSSSTSSSSIDSSCSTSSSSSSSSAHPPSALESANKPQMIEMVNISTPPSPSQESSKVLSLVQRLNVCLVRCVIDCFCALALKYQTSQALSTAPISLSLSLSLPAHSSSLSASALHSQAFTTASSTPFVTDFYFPILQHIASAYILHPPIRSEVFSSSSSLNKSSNNTQHVHQKSSYTGLLQDSIVEDLMKPAQFMDLSWLDERLNEQSGGITSKKKPFTSWDEFLNSVPHEHTPNIAHGEVAALFSILLHVSRYFSFRLFCPVAQPDQSQLAGQGSQSGQTHTVALSPDEYERFSRIVEQILMYLLPLMLPIPIPLYSPEERLAMPGEAIPSPCPDIRHLSFCLLNSLLSPIHPQPPLALAAAHTFCPSSYPLCKDVRVLCENNIDLHQISSSSSHSENTHSAIGPSLPHPLSALIPTIFIPHALSSEKSVTLNDLPDIATSSLSASSSTSSLLSAQQSVLPSSSSSSSSSSNSSVLSDAQLLFPPSSSTQSLASVVVPSQQSSSFSSSSSAPSTIGAASSIPSSMTSSSSSSSSSSASSSSSNSSSNFSSSSSPRFIRPDNIVHSIYSALYFSLLLPFSTMEEASKQYFPHLSSSSSSSSSSSTSSSSSSSSITSSSSSSCSDSSFANGRMSNVSLLFQDAYRTICLLLHTFGWEEIPHIISFAFALQDRVSVGVNSKWAPEEIWSLMKKQKRKKKEEKEQKEQKKQKEEKEEKELEEKKEHKTEESAEEKNPKEELKEDASNAGNVTLPNSDMNKIEASSSSSSSSSSLTTSLTLSASTSSDKEDNGNDEQALEMYHQKEYIPVSRLLNGLLVLSIPASSLIQLKKAAETHSFGRQGSYGLVKTSVPVPFCTNNSASSSSATAASASTESASKSVVFSEPTVLLGDDITRTTSPEAAPAPMAASTLTEIHETPSSSALSPSFESSPPSSSFQDPSSSSSSSNLSEDDIVAYSQIVRPAYIHLFVAQLFYHVARACRCRDLAIYVGEIVAARLALVSKFRGADNNCSKNNKSNRKGRNKDKGNGSGSGSGDESDGDGDNNNNGADDDSSQSKDVDLSFCVPNNLAFGAAGLSAVSPTGNNDSLSPPWGSSSTAGMIMQMQSGNAASPPMSPHMLSRNTGRHTHSNTLFEQMASQPHRSSLSPGNSPRLSPSASPPVPLRKLYQQQGTASGTNMSAPHLLASPPRSPMIGSPHGMASPVSPSSPLQQFQLDHRSRSFVGLPADGSSIVSSPLSHTLANPNSSSQRHSTLTLSAPGNQTKPNEDIRNISSGSLNQNTYFPTQHQQQHRHLHHHHHHHHYPCRRIRYQLESQALVELSHTMSINSITSHQTLMEQRKRLNSRKPTFEKEKDGEEKQKEQKRREKAEAEQDEKHQQEEEEGSNSEEKPELMKESEESDKTSKERKEENEETPQDERTASPSNFTDQSVGLPPPPLSLLEDKENKTNTPNARRYQSTLSYVGLPGMAAVAVEEDPHLTLLSEEKTEMEDVILSSFIKAPEPLVMTMKMMDTMGALPTMNTRSTLASSASQRDFASERQALLLSLPPSTPHPNLNRGCIQPNQPFPKSPYQNMKERRIQTNAANEDYERNAFQGEVSSPQQSARLFSPSWDSSQRTSTSPIQSQYFHTHASVGSIPQNPSSLPTHSTSFYSSQMQPFLLTTLPGTPLSPPSALPLSPLSDTSMSSSASAFIPLRRHIRRRRGLKRGRSTAVLSRWHSTRNLDSNELSPNDENEIWTDPYESMSCSCTSCSCSCSVSSVLPEAYSHFSPDDALRAQGIMGSDLLGIPDNLPIRVQRSASIDSINPVQKRATERMIQRRLKHRHRSKHKKATKNSKESKEKRDSSAELKAKRHRAKARKHDSSSVEKYSFPLFSYSQVMTILRGMASLADNPESLTEAQQSAIEHIHPATLAQMRLDAPHVKTVCDTLQTLPPFRPSNILSSDIASRLWGSEIGNGKQSDKGKMENESNEDKRDNKGKSLEGSPSSLSTLNSASFTVQPKLCPVRLVNFSTLEMLSASANMDSFKTVALSQSEQNVPTTKIQVSPDANPLSPLQVLHPSLLQPHHIDTLFSFSLEQSTLTHQLYQPVIAPTIVSSTPTSTSTPSSLMMQTANRESSDASVSKHQSLPMQSHQSTSELSSTSQSDYSVRSNTPETDGGISRASSTISFPSRSSSSQSIPFFDLNSDI